jgi:hypothetical protein
MLELCGRSESRSSNRPNKPSGEFERGRGSTAVKRGQAESNDVLRPFDLVSAGEVWSDELEATVL